MDTQGSLTPTPALFEADQQPDAKRDRETGDQPLEVLGRVHVQTVLGATIAPLGNDYQRSTGSPWLQQRKIHHLPKSRGSRIASTLTDVSFLEGFQRPIYLCRPLGAAHRDVDRAPANGAARAVARVVGCAGVVRSSRPSQARLARPSILRSR
jgi:hypothetical protein